MSGRSAPQPAWAKLVAVAAVPAVVWIPGQTIGPVLFSSPVAALWVVVALIAVHRLEGPIVATAVVVIASERLDFGAPVAAAGPAGGPVTREIPTRAIDAPGLRAER